MFTTLFAIVSPPGERPSPGGTTFQPDFMLPQLLCISRAFGALLGDSPGPEVFGPQSALPASAATVRVPEPAGLFQRCAAVLGESLLDAASIGQAVSGAVERKTFASCGRRGVQSAQAAVKVRGRFDEGSPGGAFSRREFGD